jgi:succinate-semialdehyde dehydrogenase/glutarate-semialdehyde dehydrogenase
VQKNSFQTINPFSEEILSEYLFDSPSLVEKKLNFGIEEYSNHRVSSIDSRLECLQSLIGILEERKVEWARLATIEMGKPLLEAEHEVEKCIGLCRYFMENTATFLQPETISYSKKAVITKSAVGLVLGIMPWNYPFWQVFRFAIPALMGGNSVLLKHAPNVTGCALAIESAFQESKFAKGLFQVVLADVAQTQKLIVDSRVQRISFTGSNETGYKIAQAAGSAGKKCVLELGGSDPFIVLNDAPLEKIIPRAVKSRFINAGQSCISAKRFIIYNSLIEEFKQRLIQEIQSLKMGNPMDPNTQIGPLARKDLQTKVIEQMNSSNESLLFQTNQPENGFFVPVSIFQINNRQSKLWREEVFGPVASIIGFDTEEEMIELANDTSFGLGASIWSQDEEKAFILAQHIAAGNVYVNEMMKSDFALPFGGTKQSGFGKELSKLGMMEFMNLKTSIISKL